MNRHFASVVLLLTAATYAGFAIWLGFWPAALLTTFGIETSTPAILTEIRAFYGGVEIGIAISMIVLWRRGSVFAALLIGGLPLAGSAMGRCLGMLNDGFSSTHAILAAIETVGALLCLAGLIATTNDHNASE